ncbi:hypothetical protein [Janthinobacterium sp. PSPC3-1]|uniref:hypothetical protein n=1 Tax=Janthinobacterium sp. PSPC3-1 TaxID=2804653 RepID=UPI003CE8569F
MPAEKNRHKNKQGRAATLLNARLILFNQQRLNKYALLAPSTAGMHQHNNTAQATPEKPGMTTYSSFNEF